MKNKYAFGYLLILRSLIDVIRNISIVIRVTGSNGLHARLLSKLNRSFSRWPRFVIKSNFKNKTLA
jgi:hypothetical protein